MLRSLKEVNNEDSVIGFYQATSMGSFYTHGLIDTQTLYQEKLRNGGIVIVHGSPLIYELDRSLMFFPDITQSSKGNASFRAFRLSKAFLDAHKRRNFSASRYYDVPTFF